MSAIAIIADGVMYSPTDWRLNMDVDGSSSLSFAINAGPLTTVRCGARVSVGIDSPSGSTTWHGVVQSVEARGGEQRILAQDLTTATMRRRLTASGEYDPSFRFGDVIQSRGKDSQLLVIGPVQDGLTTVMSLDEGEPLVIFDLRLFDGMWEIVE